MTALREHLAAELAGKVERHGVVVWDDPEGAYTAVAEDAVPADAVFHPFDGSWFDLRRRLEKSLAGQVPPDVVAYIPASPEEPDPLEELRAVGSRFRLKLPTLVKNALGGQLTELRVAQISEQCSTITEAETALDGGDTSVDARLATIIGDTSAVGIVAALIAGTHESEINSRDLVRVARNAIASAVGGEYNDLAGDALRHAAFRQCVLATLSGVISLPEDLQSSLGPVSAAHRNTALGVVTRLQSRHDLLDIVVELATQADALLHLGALLTWSDELEGVDLTPAIEQLALSEAFSRLEAGDDDSAATLVDGRLASSWWLRATVPGADSLATKYRAVRSLARLGHELGQSVPEFDTLQQVQDWYTKEGWKVDAAYRGSEHHRVTSGMAIEELDDLFHAARHRYEAWIDRVLRATADVMTQPDVDSKDLQRSIHHRFVRGSTGRTAYVLVDALRFELAQDLVTRLATVNAEVELTSAIGTPPSITPVGMAAVLPQADVDFRIGLGAGDRLIIAVSGNPITSVKDRVRQLEHAHGEVVDMVLDDVAQRTNKELKKKLGSASLVLVRSTEIDADGESDQLAASWGSFDTILGVLQTAVAKLLHAGIGRVVITADHGFLAVRQLGGELRIDKPATGQGESHRRAWIGRGGAANESTVKVPLTAFGITSDLDIIAPRGLGVFASGGGLQFFHGGLSPQELIVPVIVITSEQDSPEPQYAIDLAVAGGKITTGVVAVSVGMTGDLFTRESRVRIQLMQDKAIVGTASGGDGYDPATESVEVDAGRKAPAVVTLRVTANLVAGSKATLEVLDAATGVRLESVDVDVAANILVDDDLE